MRELVMPEPLAGWIRSHMTNVPDLRSVRIFCGPRIPFDWLPGFRKKYIGITLWNRIHLREPFDFETPDKIELLFHELVHVRQFSQNPLWFPLSYLLKFAVKGYRNHPAEIEARAVAAELWKRYSAENGTLSR